MKNLIKKCGCKSGQKMEQKAAKEVKKPAQCCAKVSETMAGCHD
jgi:hypothetical protein